MGLQLIPIRRALHHADLFIVSLTPDNTISGILRQAAKQLTSTGADVLPDARVVWFNSVGFDREAKDRRAFSTLYGSTNVFDIDKENALRSCYFFYHSSFGRHRELDGAYLLRVYDRTATVRLCLNPLSPSWRALRASPFAGKLSNNGVVDPFAEEVEGRAMIADTDIDRKDSEAVLNYLRKKYDIPRLLNMDLNMASATIAVPNDVQ